MDGGVRHQVTKNSMLFCRTVEGLFLPEQFAGKQFEGHSYEIKRLEVGTSLVCSDLMVVP